MSLDYKNLFATASAELRRVQDEKGELQNALAECDRQIIALTKTINAIAPLIGEETVSPPPGGEAEPASGGMTETIRTILLQAGEPLTAVEVRDRLDNMGFDLNSYSNPLATIHTVLRRLGESGEVETMHELNDKESGGRKRFTMSLGKGLAVEKIAGKSFEIGNMKGFIGVGRLKRQSKTGPTS